MLEISQIWTAILKENKTLFSLYFPLKIQSRYADKQDGRYHRVHILLEEGNPISLVFQNIDPPSPSPPGECVRGEDRLARRRGGWQVNILEDERNRIALLK